MSAIGQLPGVIFMLIGPGGAGKNTIMQALIAESGQLRQLATATTRPMRANEKQGREHLFLSQRQFQDLIQNDALLEYQEVTPGKFYGIPRQTVLDCLAAGVARIADIEVLGAEILAKAYPQNVVQIFITVPGADRAAQLKILAQRMRQRVDDDTDIAQRLERAQELELPYKSRCDYVVVNENLAAAIQETRAIIEGELAARHLLGE